MKLTLARLIQILNNSPYPKVGEWELFAKDSDVDGAALYGIVDIHFEPANNRIVFELEPETKA